jgi:hypothetical protein
METNKKGWDLPTSLITVAVAEFKVHPVPEAAGDNAGYGYGVEEGAGGVHHLQPPPQQVPGGDHLPHLSNRTTTHKLALK